MNVTCARCGRLATGFAYIGAARYCHGDSDPHPTCYVQASRSMLADTTPETEKRT